MLRSEPTAPEPFNSLRLVCMLNAFREVLVAISVAISLVIMGSRSKKLELTLACGS